MVEEGKVVSRGIVSEAAVAGGQRATQPGSGGWGQQVSGVNQGVQIRRLFEVPAL